VASHHTKDKGDLGVYMVIADLGCSGFGVFLPISEHMPFDLIAVSPEGQVRRVQVKYRTLSQNGSITVRFVSTYSDSGGCHISHIDKSSFDCCAVYCPDNRKIYYIRNEEIPDSVSWAFSLRVITPRNNQRKKVIDASKFEGVTRIFEGNRPRSSTG
jgi:hypothetical protein